MSEKIVYTGFTIGPIGKTLGYAKKTRAFWVSSYLFSYLMKKLVTELKKDYEVILPFSDDDSLFNQPQRAGMFPDRCIVIGEVKNVDNLIQIVYAALAKELNTNMLKKKSIEEIEIFLTNYLQVYAITKELEKTENPIISLNSYLDTLDLQSKFIQDPQQYLEQIYNKVNGSFLIKDAFGAAHSSFDSIAEIVTRNLKKLDVAKYNKVFNNRVKDDDDGKQLQELQEEFGGDFKAFHKYLAIVQVDGDNVGKTIEQIYLREQQAGLKKFSTVLLEFAREAVKEIESYGGTPIYAGGDDLLFFAPVIGFKSQLFELVDKIDRIFAKKFAQFPETPTLSFGISISYYKYPMDQALKIASDLLFNKAKKDYPNKNAVVFQFRKNSGAVMTAGFDKSQPFYKAFVELLDTYTEFETETGILSSIIYKLETLKPLLETIVFNEGNYLDNFFKNNFNESVHKDFDNNMYLSKVKELLKKAYEEKEQLQNKKESDEFDPVKMVYGAMRLLKFLGAKADNTELV